MSSELNNLIPRIWADAVYKSLQQEMLIVNEILKEMHELHEQRMRDDPEYAAWYEIEQAASETESYWIALYENNFPPDEDEDDW